MLIKALFVLPKNGLISAFHCTREEGEVGEAAVAVVEPLHVHRVRQVEAHAVRVVVYLVSDSVGYNAGSRNLSFDFF